MTCLKTRKDYYLTKVNDNEGNQKALYKVFDKLLHRTSEPQLPSHENIEELSNRFADFFIDKIEKIRANLYSSQNISSEIPEVQATSFLEKFECVSEAEVKKKL